MSYFFTEFGPNVTTFVYPAEIFPVMVRSSAHGISASFGKIGAFAFPQLLITFHLRGAMAVAAGVSVIGLYLTPFFLPEPNQRSLEEVSNPYSDEGCGTVGIDGNEDGQQKHDEMKQPGS